MSKCYTCNNFVRIMASLFLLLFAVGLIDSMIKFISLGIDSVPSYDLISPFLFPPLLLLMLHFIVSRIQIAGDKLHIIGLFRRRELLRNNIIMEESTIHKIPYKGFQVYYFTIPLKTGRKFLFSTVSRKCKDLVQKFLRGEESLSKG